MMGFGIVTIVQCRFGSSRLKGKALRPLAGRPMLAHVLERAEAIGFPVVLATSVSSHDDQVAKLGEKLGVEVHRGDEADVLGRLSEAASNAGARIVIRVTGDCPLLAPDVALDVLKLYIQSGPGYIASNDTTSSGWPDGMDVEVFTAADLHEAAARATKQSDREHVTPWLRERLKHVVLPGPTAAPSVRLSIDTPADYDRAKDIYARLPKGDLGWEATFTAVRSAQSAAKAGTVAGNGQASLPAWPAPLIAVFKREGVTPAEAAATMTNDQLRGIKGVGDATVAKLREVYGGPGVEAA